MKNKNKTKIVLILSFFMQDASSVAPVVFAYGGPNRLDNHHTTFANLQQDPLSAYTRESQWPWCCQKSGFVLHL